MVAHLADDGQLRVSRRHKKYRRTDAQRSLVVHYETTADVALRGSSQMALHKTQLTHGVIGACLHITRSLKGNVHHLHSAFIKESVAGALVLC